MRRRGRAIATTFAVAAFFTCVLALAWPPTYRSTGTILIEQQEIPTDLVRSTVTSYADERVQIISQRVMTTQNLLGIIRRYELYQGLQKRESRERVIERMRDDIRFRMISADVVDPRTGVPRQATIAFSVSYDNASPDLAVKVANEITSLYLNENLTSRNRLAEDASSFLTKEGDRMSARIAELEGKLATFKEKNINQLPELVQLNMSLLDRTEQQLRDAVAEQRSLAQQKVYLEAQLAQLKPNSAMFSDSGDRILTPTDRLRALKSELASARALYSEGHPDIARLTREIAGLEAQGDAAADSNDLLRQLDAARAELGVAREKYAPEHPDVRNLERTVAALESELAKPRAVARPRAIETPDNPAFIQINAQLSSIQNDQRALADKISSLREQADGYQKKVAMTPIVEREYRELARDYENAQLRYQEVRAKQNEAQLAQNPGEQSQGRAIHPDRAAVAARGARKPEPARSVHHRSHSQCGAGRGARCVARGHRHVGARPPRCRSAGQQCATRADSHHRHRRGHRARQTDVAIRGRWRHGERLRRAGRNSYFLPAAGHLVVHRHAPARDLTGVDRGTFGLVHRAATAPFPCGRAGAQLRARSRSAAATARGVPG